jgi:hypothetical protein
MHRTAWPVLLSISQLATAATPACCRLFGFDATRMLGPDPAVCGKILDADSRARAQEESAAERKRAAQCALDAQAQGRPFVYTYRLLAAPDMDLVVQAVVGAHGERLLMKLGLYAGENMHKVEACQSLAVLPDGKVRGSGCYAY